MKNAMPIAGYFGPYRTITKERYGHEETLYDTVTEEIFQLIHDLDINLINKTENDYQEEEKQQDILDALALAEKYDIGVLVNDTRIQGECSIEQLEKYLSDYNHYKSFRGITIIDEPFTNQYGRKHWLLGRNRMEDFASKSILLNSRHSTLGYINLNPMGYGLWKGELPWETVGETMRAYVTYREGLKQVYRDYLETYIQTCQPKVLSWDYYVFDKDAIRGCIRTSEEYFDNLSLIREKSLKYHIPFWAYVQAGSNWNDDQVEMETGLNEQKHPTQGEMFWNINTSLAYGAKGIQYFPLIQPYWFAYTKYGTWDYNRNGLIGADGSRTCWYESARRANKWIRAIEKVLMHAMSKEILVVGEIAQRETSISKVSNEELVDICAEFGAVVGVFMYQGKSVYYVVNYNTKNSQTITLRYQETQVYSGMLQTSDASSHVSNSFEGTGKEIIFTLEAGSAAIILSEKEDMYEK